MDPRDRADAALARASARNRWAVTPNNATSPMDAKPTVQIPRVVVDAADPREQDPDTTVVLPGSVAAGQVPVPPQQGQTQQLPQPQGQPLPQTQQLPQPQTQQLPQPQTQQLPQGQTQQLPQGKPLPQTQPTQQIPAAQQSQPLPHVQRSQPLPHVQQPQRQQQPQQGPDPDQQTKQLPGIIPTTQQTPGRRISLTDRLSGALPENDQP
ncbi:hypothetical protein [Kutzneria sp. NPDC052558]|uniref:hypothetical protein n=1 Tax=Kutzneria sp. NPDC052558 TaxID=3364121 RepID=UPI0037CC73E6